MDYAVIKTGGKQYRVAEGTKLKVETLAKEVGEEVIFDMVLVMKSGDSIRTGRPHVAGAQVVAKVLSHGRGDKIRIFKMRRRKHYQHHQGHRQNFTEICVSTLKSPS